MIDCSGARALAESNHDCVGADRMNVTAFQCVIEATLAGTVIQNAGVAKLGVVGEEHLHDQLFNPAHAVPHRTNQHVPPDDHRRVAREEQVRQRRQ